MAEVPVIELRDIEVAYGDNKVLDGFSLTVEAGQKLSLVGESSSGKSTLLKIIVGLIKPDRGWVMLFGRDLAGLSDSEMRKLRQRIGMQFQSGALFDSMTVIENLKLARRESARDPASRRAADDPAEPMELLSAVGLAKAANRQPFQLSGGMRKRAALARAITTDPDLAIFDEPTAGLDPVTSRRIIDLLQAVSVQQAKEPITSPPGLDVSASPSPGRSKAPPGRGAAMIMATTDVQVARYFSPDLLILNQGRLWAHDTIDNLRSSRDVFVQKLLSRLIQ